MWLIFKKEFKELLRDKKTIIFMIGLPLLVLCLAMKGPAVRCTRAF